MKTKLSTKEKIKLILLGVLAIGLLLIVGGIDNEYAAIRSGNIPSYLKEEK